MLRVFEIDAERCDCGGTFRAIACNKEPAVIRAILDSMGLRSSPIRLAPARPPPQETLRWA